MSPITLTFSTLSDFREFLSQPTASSRLVEFWPDGATAQDADAVSHYPVNPWSDVRHYSEHMEQDIPVEEMNTCHIYYALRKLMANKTAQEAMDNVEFYAFVTVLAERFLREPEPVEQSTGNCFADSLKSGKSHR